jgi:AcrR family transcriptional regulator
VASLRETQKLQTRQLLLDRALHLFGSKGYAATTIDDIAASVGTTRTTFYQHFASKSQLMQAVIRMVDEIFTTADDPSLAVVVERGERGLVEAWLERKFDQWVVVRRHLTATYQAAAIDPEIQGSLDAWLEDVAGAIREGLDRADRFDAASRRVRAVLAFGQLEYLAKRWLRVGWAVDREICLQTLTDSWCHLLTERAPDR